MSSSAANVMSQELASSDIADVAVEVLQSQGKVTGIIIPPPDIRLVVDKTANFVARNGKSFEQKIVASAEVCEVGYIYLH
jgi:hypothetical protein